MPRNVLLSRNGQPSAGPSSTQPQPVPAIRFISATPSIHEHYEPQIEVDMDAYPLPVNRVAPFTAAPLAPRPDAGLSPRKRLVPKKSKLGLLSAGAKSLGKDKFKSKSKADDFSDVVRRVGAPQDGSSRNDGFEIYVDHCEDEEDASILVVKKKKSRAALDNVGWGQGALGEVTNVGSNLGTTTSALKSSKSNPNILNLPSKGDENQNSKWWNVSIGRGRKDAKGKENGPMRSKTPEPFSKSSTDAEPRARFNSLDSSRLLGFSGFAQKAPEPMSQVSTQDVPVPIRTQRQRSGTLSSLSTLLTVAGSENGSDDLLAPPAPVEGQGQGSIALRAMRSMRSMARMKSWANLGSEKTDKEGNNDTNTNTFMRSATTATIKTKEKGRKLKDKEGKSKKKENKMAKRPSTSSFEAGTLGSLPHSPIPPLPEYTLNKKPSKLALGGLLPGSLRLGTVRPLGSRLSSTSSTASRPATPTIPQAPSGTLYGLPNSRLSADASAHLVMGPNGRPCSAYSTSSQGSSLRPASTASGISVISRVSSGMSASAFSTRSARSSNSSVASVRWDEDGLAGVKERQRREREMRREERRNNPDAKESRRSSDGRKRTAIAEIFPEVRSSSQSKRSSFESNVDSVRQPPVFTVEEATTDGHGDCDSDCTDTPLKRVRPRPMSDQLPGKNRPKAFSNDAEAGVLSILDAATNDLASLINRLDLEATPASVVGSPLQPLRDSPSIASLGRAGQDSPLRGRKYIFDVARDAPLLYDNRDSTASIASLRTFAMDQAKSQPVSKPVVPPTRQQPMGTLEARRMLIGQRIAPWSELDWQVSPKKKSTPASKVFRPAHRRTITPTPEIDLGPVFQPLRPAAQERVADVEIIPSASATPVPTSPDQEPPSSQTFGSSKRVAKIGRNASTDLGFDDAAPPSPSPPARRPGKHARKQSVLSVLCDTGATLPRGSLKNLGLGGTLSGSESEVFPEDPDSDFPDELQVVLSGQSDDDTTQTFDNTFSYRPRSYAPSPGLPPLIGLPAVQPEPKDMITETQPAPVFRAALIDQDDNQVDIDDGEGTASEDDTKKSFDFTRELQRLNESGGSDRRSFVEQVENAFRTPANVELGFNVGKSLFLKSDIPPIPALPLKYRQTPDKDLVPCSTTDPGISIINSEPSNDQSLGDSATSDTLDRLLAECEEDICRPYSGLHKSQSSMRSKASDGRLNTSFRFGGRPSIPGSVDESPEGKPLTLSDIIPPISHTRSRSGSSLLGDDSVMKSILGNVYEDDTSVVNSIMAHAQAAVPRPRVNSNTSSKRFSRNSADISKLSSHSRNTSEASFTGFESFDEVRRGFEFHPNRPAFYPPPGATSRGQHNKHESFYSVASISSYGSVLNSGVVDPFGYATSSRPVSTGDDMSVSMSLTVDDTFSFMKRGPARQRVDSNASTSSFYFRPGARRVHRRNESNFSSPSVAPPVSLYNRSFGGHRRNDSNTSVGSVSHSYAMHSAGRGRSAWARHNSSPSDDSIFSELSAANVARPGLGDKMFEMMDYGMPLAAITASPTGSVFSEQDDVSQQYPQQMMYDSLFDGTNEPKTTIEDSLFEKTGQRTSVESSDDVFEFDLSRPQQESYMRLHQFRPISMMSMGSTHSIPKDEDTMITMLGGGHVRRRSVDSCVDGSPCVPLERKKHTALQHLARVLRFDHGHDELPASVPDRMSKISPDKVVVPKPSIASTSSYQFGTERMIKAGQGLLQRQSLEESALMAHGEDILASLENSRVFSRPGPASRSRSSTVTSASSGSETPPLSASDSSSVSSGSQSSIDLGHLNTLLTGATYPSSGIARARAARARARGFGHRRRISQVPASRSSVYETIEEESAISSTSTSPEQLSARTSSEKDFSLPLPQRDSVYIVDPETSSIISDWDDEHGIVTMRKYWALRDEAHEIVTESKKVWMDTAFSVFAMQSFEPPANRSGMAAMLEQSQKTYGPLPSELRAHRVRSRTSSRASPYPVRSRRVSFTAEQEAYIFSTGKPFASPDEHESEQSMGPLRDISINPNISNPKLSVPEATKPGIKVFSPPPVVDTQPFSSFSVHVDAEKPVAKAGNPLPRPRVNSNVRRTALGWSKRSTGKGGIAKTNNATSKTSTGSEKENSTSQGGMFAPNDSLRISRPRPRGRLASARAALTAV